MSTATNTAAAWLDEHLAFAVPLRMAEIVAQVRKAPPHPWGLTWRDRVRRIGQTSTYFFDPGNAGQGSTPTVVVATMGDAMFGESARGRAATVAANLTTAIAAAALLNETGVAYRGLHWCRTGACPACPARPTPDTTNITEEAA